MRCPSTRTRTLHPRPFTQCILTHSLIAVRPIQLTVSVIPRVLCRLSASSASASAAHNLLISLSLGCLSLHRLGIRLCIIPTLLRLCTRNLGFIQLRISCILGRRRTSRLGSRLTRRQCRRPRIIHISQAQRILQMLIAVRLALCTHTLIVPLQTIQLRLFLMIIHIRRILRREPQIAQRRQPIGHRRNHLATALTLLSALTLLLSLAARPLRSILEHRYLLIKPPKIILLPLRRLPLRPGIRLSGFYIRHGIRPRQLRRRHSQTLGRNLRAILRHTRSTPHRHIFIPHILHTRGIRIIRRLLRLRLRLCLRRPLLCIGSRFGRLCRPRILLHCSRHCHSTFYILHYIAPAMLLPADVTPLTA